MARNVDPDVKEKVREMILNHRGRNNAITSREINNQINVDNVGSFPGTRAIIRELVVDEGIPIAGGPNGYFLIETREELDGYVDTLDSRALEMMERKVSVLKAMNEWPEMDFDNDESDEDII